MVSMLGLGRVGMLGHLDWEGGRALGMNGKSTCTGSCVVVSMERRLGR
jgi:hypothetical protein